MDWRCQCSSVTKDEPVWYQLQMPTWRGERLAAAAVVSLAITTVQSTKYACYASVCMDSGLCKASGV